MLCRMSSYCNKGRFINNVKIWRQTRDTRPGLAKTRRLSPRLKPVKIYRKKLSTPRCHRYTLFMQATLQIQKRLICPRCRCILALSGRSGTIQSRKSLFTRTFTSQKPARQDAALQEHPPSDFSMPFPATQDRGILPMPQIRFESSDGPIIRYEPLEPPSPEQQRARKQALGLDVLGKPAQVLIVDIEEKRKRSLSLRSSHLEPDDSKEDLPTYDILQKVDEEKGVPTLDDVHRNIEDLRDSWLRARGDPQGLVKDKDWEELASQLKRGFNRTQLQSYIERLESTGRSDSEDLDTDFTSRTISRSPWRAGQSPISTARAPPFTKKGNATANSDPARTNGIQRKSKNIVIKKLVSNYWNIQPVSTERSMGYLDVKLPQLHFELILKNRR